MQVMHAHAALTTSDAIDESLTTIVARSVLEAALAEGEPSTLWFEVGDDVDSRRIEVDLSTADLEELLRMSGSDDVALTLDGDEIAGLFGEPPDVEAHGLKGAIAIVVTGAALLAPAGQAAVTQVSPAATAQISPAATAQISPEATTQLRPAATAQVTNAAATAQVATVKAKLAKSNAKFKNFQILRGGLFK
jgi:cytoskeletal protein RodZ